MCGTKIKCKDIIMIQLVKRKVLMKSTKVNMVVNKSKRLIDRKLIMRICKSK